MTNLVTSTNLVAIGIIAIVTNWTSIGTFQKTTGEYYYVFEGQISTNEVGVMTKDGQSVSHIFKSTLGPIVPDQKLQPILGNPDEQPRTLRLPQAPKPANPPLPPPK